MGFGMKTAWYICSRGVENVITWLLGSVTVKSVTARKENPKSVFIPCYFKISHIFSNWTISRFLFTDVQASQDFSFFLLFSIPKSTVFVSSCPTIPVHVPSSLATPHSSSGGVVIVYEKLSNWDSSLNTSTNTPLSNSISPFSFLTRPTYGAECFDVTRNVTP